MGAFFISWCLLRSSGSPFNEEEQAQVTDQPRTLEPSHALAHRDLSIRDFCMLKDISISTYYKLKRSGNAPAETLIPGTYIRRITSRALAAWEKKMDKHSTSKAAKLERSRRHAQAVDAGKKSVLSDKHVSKTNRVKKKVKARASQVEA